MATSKSKSDARAKARTALVETPNTTSAPPDPKQAEQVDKIVEAETVLVEVPRGFTLTLDDGSPVAIRAGVQNMPAHIANHWYSKHWGVKPYDLDNPA
mgnify:CR=1 FL=1